ncbi:MAG: ATP-binding protein [Granulosicoccus sp.]
MPASNFRGKPSLLRAFLLFTAGVGVLFSLMVLFIWLSTGEVATREQQLINELLPELDAAYELTAAAAGLQSQGFFLRSSDSQAELKRRRENLDGTVEQILETLGTMTTVSPDSLASLRQTVDYVTGTAIGLAHVREQQIDVQAQIVDELPERVGVLEELNKKIQQRVVELTDQLLELNEELLELDVEYHQNVVGSDVFNEKILDYERMSLSIQDHLVLSQDVVSLIAVVEKVPLLPDEKNVVLALQSRDLAVNALASRSIYMSSSEYGEAMLTHLRTLRAAMQGKESLFDLQKSVIVHESVQDTMHALLKEQTNAILDQANVIRNETIARVSTSAQKTLKGIDVSRLLPVFLNIIALILLAAMSYWLFYRRTVVPLIELTSHLDDVGSDFFPSKIPECYFQEMNALSSAMMQLDLAQKNMLVKDFQLQQINRDLLRANDELQQFAHIASHDLQEPLRKLQQFSALLKEDFGDKLDGDAVYFINTIHKSAERMGLLIKETLAYSRSGSSKQKIERVDLSELLEQLWDEMDLAVRDKKGEITSDKLPIVFANKLGMAQLFRNLLLNGLKYSKPGSPAKIDISVEAAAVEVSELVYIRVTDNGIGIPSKYLQRIFFPFERLHGIDVPGTGLGLAICKKVCESHGWHLDVGSELNHGSTFLITIPTSSVSLN